MRALALVSSAIYFRVVHGLFPPRPVPPTEHVSDEVLMSLTDPEVVTSGIAYFDQFLDHNNTELGTFSQTYWYNATFYQGPGSPIVFFTPGEVAATGYVSYLSDQALTGLIAKEIGGAVVMLEHRYWGNSTPFDIQSTKNLQYLTLDQSVADVVRFARTVKLPFDNDGSGKAPGTPWVWVGGSYSGALGAWVESLAPGTFWTTHTSSGPVQAIYDYWQYFYPIQQGMPRNCSVDYAAIIDHVDSVLIDGTPEQQAELKELFLLQDLAHNDDIAAAISSPIWAWQSIQQYSGYSRFYQMCDAIEGVNKAPNGVGLELALPSFAQWFTTKYLPGYCSSYGYEEWTGDYEVQCFDTYNSTIPFFADWSAYNGIDRTWVWMTCNEPFFYWQSGAPADRPTVFSRLASAEYWQRQCELFFPREGEYTYASALGKTAEDVNGHTKGWFLNEYLRPDSRLLWVNGEFDPWRSGGVESEFRPGGGIRSTPEQPSILIPGARHCNDLRTRNGQLNSAVAAAQAEIVSQMATWTKEFYGPRNGKRSFLTPKKRSAV